MGISERVLAPRGTGNLASSHAHPHHCPPQSALPPPRIPLLLGPVPPKHPSGNPHPRVGTLVGAHTARPLEGISWERPWGSRGVLALLPPSFPPPSSAQTASQPPPGGSAAHPPSPCWLFPPRGGLAPPLTLSLPALPCPFRSPGQMQEVHCLRMH